MGGSVEPISTVAQDYLKTIWSTTEWDGAPVTVTALADRFGTSRASASDTIKRLASQGLLLHEPYSDIILTPEGERHAVAMVRRHRLLETFLAEILGYGWDEVHAEAESLEHAVSDLMIERVDALLGHPTADPHGDPIPSPSGVVHYPADPVRLTDAGLGEYRVTRISDADSDRLAYFAEAGIMTGARLRVTERNEHAHTIRVDPDHGAEVALAAPATDDVLLIADPGRRSGGGEQLS